VTSRSWRQVTDGHGAGGGSSTDGAAPHRERPEARANSQRGSTHAPSLPAGEAAAPNNAGAAGLAGRSCRRYRSTCVPL
jgi:hypothetical protein